MDQQVVVPVDGGDEPLIDISTLIKQMNEDDERRKQPREFEDDEISCLTEYSIFLSDIRDPGRNDVIFRADLNHYGVDCHNHHEGNRRFSRLLVDYKEVYRTSHQAEDRELVVTEVVRVWRSLDPTGRFLVQTTGIRKSTAEEPEKNNPHNQQTTSNNGVLLYHDVGDEEARERAEKLLRGDPIVAVTKHHPDGDDVTASTANSSTGRSAWSRDTKSNKTKIEAANAKGDCFGSSFRGLFLGFLAGKSKDGILNQYLP